MELNNGERVLERNWAQGGVGVFILLSQFVINLHRLDTPWVIGLLLAALVMLFCALPSRRLTDRRLVVYRPVVTWLARFLPFLRPLDRRLHKSVWLKDVALVERKGRWIHLHADGKTHKFITKNDKAATLLCEQLKDLVRELRETVLLRDVVRIERHGPVVHLHSTGKTHKLVSKDEGAAARLCEQLRELVAQHEREAKGRLLGQATRAILAGAGRSALRCPYCHGDLARSEGQACSGCHTLHHADCLAIHGGCAVLACAGVRVRVTV